jgi:hypothetical protein
MQGLYKLGRGAKEDPRRFAAVAGATALASIALYLAYQDDPDFRAREDWYRESYWWFRIGDVAYRIPKPFEIGAIATLAERGVEAMVSGEFTGAESAKRMAAIAWSQLSLNPTPQLFKPALDLWANVDSFTGRRIETMGMERLSPPQRIAPNTSAVTQFAGNANVPQLYESGQRFEQTLADLHHLRQIGALEQANELHGERGRRSTNATSAPRQGTPCKSRPPLIA